MIEIIENCQRCGGLHLARVLANCMDMASIDLTGKHHSGYLPRDLGIGGDDVHFVYCLDCGQIRGAFPLPPTGIELGRD
jgi:hypothetical protein